MKEAQGSNPTNYNSGNGTGSNGNGSNGNGSNSNGNGSNENRSVHCLDIQNVIERASELGNVLNHVSVLL